MSRWVPIELRSRSGKQLFVCTRCGRVSPTPDKICNVPPSITAELRRLEEMGIPPEKLSEYWKDWVGCGEGADAALSKKQQTFELLEVLRKVRGEQPQMDSGRKPVRSKKRKPQ